MISIKAIYNGKDFIAMEDFPKEKKYNVVITLLEELNDEKEIQDFSSQTDAFAFWKVKEEDLYQDYLTKK